MTTDPRFPELVSLACHDLRTPLATVAGFAATLLRVGGMDEKSERYVTLIQTAAGQLAHITDDLAVAARVAGGRYEPLLEARDSLALSEAAAATLGDGLVTVSGSGTNVLVDPGPVTRALASFANAALRHGALEHIAVDVDHTRITFRPVPEAAAAVVLSTELRDLGAAAGRVVIEALGGSVEDGDEAVVVALPAA
jgi:signal transduction histidine kinase